MGTKGHQMERFAHLCIFQKIASLVMVIFMGLMVAVVLVAYARPSGNTRQDMSKAQLIRKEANKAEKRS